MDGIECSVARWDRVAWIPRLKKVKVWNRTVFNPRADTARALFPGPPISLPSLPHGTRENRAKTRFLCRDRNTIMVCFVGRDPSPVKMEGNFFLRFDSRLVIDLSSNLPIFRSKSYFVPSISRVFKICFFFFPFFFLSNNYPHSFELIQSFVIQSLVISTSFPRLMCMIKLRFVTQYEYFWKYSRNNLIGQRSLHNSGRKL